MGRRAYHRYTDDDWRDAGGTVDQLQANGWPVYAHCQKCDVRIWVHLEFVAFKMGGRASLWGRTGHCRVVGCPGRVVFYLRPAEATMSIAMTAKRPG